MNSLVAFASLATVMVASQNLNQPTHGSLNQTAEVVCSGNGTSYELIFFLESNGDRIDRIYTVNKTDEYINGNSTFSDLSGDILGDGTAGMPYKFTIVANGVLPDGLQLSEESKYSLAVVEGDVVSVYVMAKFVFEAPFYDSAYFADDVLYKVSCNFSELQSVWVSTGKIQVDGKIYEEPSVVVETAQMYIYDDPGSAPIDQTDLGTPILLALTLGEPSKAVGMYARNCYVCNDQYCPKSRLALPFIDSYGCPSGNSISQFSVIPVSKVILTTLFFPAFLLSTGNLVYFTCHVNFCYSKNDPRCLDFCAYSKTKNSNLNEIQERRRRSAEDERPEETVSAHITINIDADQADSVQLFRDQLLRSAEERAAQVDDVPSNKDEPLVNNALLGLVTGLSVLLTIGLMAAVVVWRRATQTTPAQKA